MGDELRLRLEGLSDDEFERLFGAFRPMAPAEVAGLLDGLGAPWWVAGGWAIEAFTGVHRHHADLDVSILARDIPVLVEHFLGSHHVWAAGSGLLQPLLHPAQRFPEWAGQIWVRREATSPWLLDVLITPDRDGRWVFRRDPDVVEALERVTWVAADGVTYLRPEVCLAYKASLDRPKDTADLEATLPRLGAGARRWLRDTVARLHPDHRWLDRLGAGPDEA